ncbi:MAG TPA: polysaccharide deacetylase, partial [Candidatus Latescibacteria bacterium]|nr:polysaccharide deacetylase [Candidatus Latescibacterota bacterium]
MSTSPSPWPDACEAAVSLTFDDGMPSQLDRAIPILGEHDQKGTFYINPRGDNWQENLEPWRTVAQAGHEIGNHTVNHPCSSAFKDTRDGGLEQMTLA